MADVIWLVPALPLAGFLILLVFGRRLGDPRAGWLATLMVFASFVVTVGVFFDLLSRPAEDRIQVETLFSWVPVGALQVAMAFLVYPPGIPSCPLIPCV